MCVTLKLIQFFCARGAMKGVQLPKETPQRVEVVEEHTERMGGPTFKAVKPKTYQILQQELGGEPEASGPKEATPQVTSSGSGCKYVTHWWIVVGR